MEELIYYKGYWYFISSEVWTREVAEREKKGGREKKKKEGKKEEEWRKVIWVFS